MGTGFHPELTGRENTYLNGAILGMKRREIQREVRRDRRVQRDREVHRHAGQALLERNVRPARVRRRGAPRPGGPDHRRGARRRGLRVPAALHGADRGHLELGPHGDLRLSRHAGDHAALRSRATGSRAAVSCREGRREDVVSRVPPGRVRRRARRSTFDADARARDRVRSASSRRGSSTRTATTVQHRRRPRAVRDRDAVRRARRDSGRSSRSSSSPTTAARSSSTRSTPTPRWRVDARAGHLHVHRLDPAEPPQRGRHRASTSRSPRSAARRRLANHVNVPSIVKFHVVDPGLGDTAKGLFTGQLRGGVRPLLDWTTEYADADVASRASATRGVADDRVGRVSSGES